jgi:hypothetical protein
VSLCGVAAGSRPIPALGNARSSPDDPPPWPPAAYVPKGARRSAVEFFRLMACAILRIAQKYGSIASGQHELKFACSLTVRLQCGEAWLTRFAQSGQLIRRQPHGGAAFAVVQKLGTGP